MFTSKIGRVGAVALCLLAVKLAAGCSDTGTPQANGGGGTAGQSPGAAGSGTSAGAGGLSTSAGSSATAGTTSGGGGAAAGNAAGGAAGATAGSGGAVSGGAGGAAAGAGGAAGGTGGAAPMTFTPCNTAPADTVPALKRGPAITGFQGMQTAGLIIAVPGEVGTLYVIGHRNGAVYTVQDGKVAATPLVNVDVANGGNNEQGLLSMAFHPSFATNHLFYLFYTAAGGGAMTIDEFERLTPTTSMKKRNIYSHERAATGGMFHNGGSLSFNPKDAMPYLYFSVGNNESNNAGDPNGFAGRVLRFDLDSKASTTFAYGLRNPYRMTIDRLTGDMYIADVANGPGGTVIFNANGKTGTDYGYRDNNGAIDVNEGVLRDDAGAAIIGGYVYRGNKIPGLCGRYFYGNYQGGTVKSIVVKDGKKVGGTAAHGMLSVPGDITSFGEDGEGELYMASMTNTIYKIIAQ